MTPQQMADWLERNVYVRERGTEVQAEEIVDYLRCQPTDAQKVEALRAVSDYVELLENCQDGYYRASETNLAKAYPGAMRLLGLNPEGV